MVDYPGGHLPAGTMKRLAEAANNWITLHMIWQQFGPSTDGAVERDMRAAEDRLARVLGDLPVVRYANTSGGRIAGVPQYAEKT